MFAFSDKYNSHKKLKEAFITIEGSNKYLIKMKTLFEKFGNSIQIISNENKAKYHLASVVVSNHVIGLINTSINLLKECGFDENKALEALGPLMLNNINNVIEKGVTQSLTGPIERCDTDVIKSHLDCLNEEDRELYKLISRKIIQIAINKNQNKDYSHIERLLEG